MAFGKIGSLRDKRKGLFLGFKTKPDSYDITNKYYFSDGSGEHSWRAILSATGSFYDNFITYDNVNTWNEDLSTGTASASANILTISSGAGAGNYAHIYSVYLSSKTLRELGTLTFEARLKRNSISAANDTFYFGLGNTSQTADVPATFIAFTTTSTNNDKMKGSASGSSTATFDQTNNGYATWKIILTDKATPTAKYYLNGVLKITQNLSTTYRDLSYFGFFQANQNGLGNQTLDVTYIKITE